MELEPVTATSFEHEKIKETSEQAKDPEIRARLWEWSVAQTGVGAD